MHTFEATFLTRLKDWHQEEMSNLNLNQLMQGAKKKMLDATQLSVPVYREIWMVIYGYTHMF